MGSCRKRLLVFKFVSRGCEPRFWLVSLALFVLRAPAAEDHWSQLVSQGLAQQASANYAEADATFRSALKLVETGPDWKPTARTLSFLARTDQSLGRFDEAETLYRKALKLDQDHGSALDAAAVQINLARIGETRNHAAQSLALCEEAIRTFRDLLGPAHPFVADGLDTLASLYMSLGEDLKAASTFEQSLAIREKARPADGLRLAATLNNFAGLQMTLGRYKEAETSYRRALDLRERGLGSEHPQTAETRLGLVTLYTNERQFTKADSLAPLVLPALTASLGTDHVRVANASEEIAALDEQEGRLEDAELLLKRARAIYLKAFGPEYGHIAVVLTRLSEIDFDRKDYKGAEELCRQALQIGREAFGPEHPEYAAILHRLAMTLLIEARYEESATALAQALEIRQRSLGANHPSTARWELDYALVLRKVHRKKEAEQIEARARQTLHDAERDNGQGYSVDIKDLERASKLL
jgi:tetratricopeptide (TPR) repeat protein